MKVLLQEDWDIAIHPPVHGVPMKGHFVGREKELSLLSSEILRRDSGAILITGYRGVGKTSLVYKAISNVRAKDDNVVPVLISASQLHDETVHDPARNNGGQNPKRLIIESIIRRLYATTRDDKRLAKFQSEIEDLYKKAVAAKFEQTRQAGKEESSVKQLTREQVSLINVAQVGIFTLCATIALLLLFIPGWSENPIVKIVAVLIAVPVPIGINYVRKMTRSATTKSLLSAEAKEVYQFDGSIGNLEFDLEKLHRDLSAQGKKLIYVIDELDKLEAKTVGELLKFFKNLFTLSEALFIFIADEEIYGYNWTGTAAKGRRPLEYTFFTSRYFLSRPAYDDLRSYLATITEASEMLPEDLEKLFRAFCFVAENDFFDLRSALTDRITSFDGKQPVIEFAQLSSEDQQCARFHTIFTSLFERKYMSASHSRWYENERPQNLLFGHLRKLYNAYATFAVGDPDGEDLDAQIVRDCNAVLTRVGALKEERAQAARLRGVEVSIHTYTYNGNIPEDPPEMLSEPSEFERAYISRVTTYYEYVRAIQNAFRVADGDPEISETDFLDDLESRLGRQWNYDFWSPISTYAELNSRFLNERPLPTIQRDHVEKRTKEVTNVMNSLFVNSLPLVIAQMLIELYPQGGLLERHLQESAELFNAIEAMRAVLRRRNPICVHTPNWSHQVAIVGGESEDIRRSAEELKAFRKSHRVIIIGDFGESPKSYTHSVYFVNTNTPETLKVSLTRVLKSTKAFWRSEEESDSE